MSIEKEDVLSVHIKFFGEDNFNVICSRELPPIEKQDAFNNLLKLLKSTANEKDDFLYISGLLQKSFYWGTIDGYIEGVREYDVINRVIGSLIDVSCDQDFEMKAREVMKENSRRRILNIHERQNIIRQ